MAGLVHVSRIPKELIAALVSRCKSYNRSLSELENIFSAEDVVSVRVQSVVVEDKKIDLSMLPHRVDFLTGDEVSDDAKNGDEIFASGRESDKELEQIIAIVDEQRRKVKKKEYCCHDTL